MQTEISDVINDSRLGLQELCSFFDKTKQLHLDVQKHLAQAGNLGTTKSSMFEDVDNMMSQIPLVIKDYTSHHK